MRYIDASVTVDAITGRVAPGWDPDDSHCFSELMGVEVRRTLQRLQMERSVTAAHVAQSLNELVLIEATADIARIDRPTLLRASGPFPIWIKTLDAIHLATALLLRENQYPDLIFATHDRRLALAARLMEFQVVGAD